MNPEHWSYIIMGLSGMLFALGGTKISTNIDGKKEFRRFVLPIVIGLILFFALHVVWWRVLLLALTSYGVFSLGYGDNAPWFSFKKFWHGFVFPFNSGYPKVFTACMIPLPTLFVGFSPLIFAYPLVFLGMFAVGKINWKLFEFFAGAFFGACVVGALSYKPF